MIHSFTLKNKYYVQKHVVYARQEEVSTWNYKPALEKKSQPDLMGWSPAQSEQCRQQMVHKQTFGLLTAQHNVVEVPLPAVLWNSAGQTINLSQFSVPITEPVFRKN